MKNEQDVVDKYYEKIFNELLNVAGDDIVDISIIVTDIDGRTYKRSWKDRNDWLDERRKATLL